MAAFPTEVFAIIAQRVAPQDLPNFRLASTAFEQLSRRPFTSKCFQHMKTSANMAALDHLFSTVNHHQFGPAIKKITISMNGVDDNPAFLNTRFSDIFRVLRLRGQQVAVEIVVTATDIHINWEIDHHLAHVIKHLVRVDLQHRLFAGPLTVSISSSAMSKGTLPTPPRFFNAVHQYCIRRSLSLNFIDAEGSLNYDATTKTLLISGLKDYQIRQITRLAAWLRLKHAKITDCERTEATMLALHYLLKFHRSTLVSVDVKDVEGRDFDVV
ncbi:hypothetical protein KCU73_g3447, partial [Aureobasidium melanogenum]